MGLPEQSSSTLDSIIPQNEDLENIESTTIPGSPEQIIILSERRKFLIILLAIISFFLGIGLGCVLIIFWNHLQKDLLVFIIFLPILLILFILLFVPLVCGLFCDFLILNVVLWKLKRLRPMTNIYNTIIAITKLGYLIWLASGISFEYEGAPTTGEKVYIIGLSLALLEELILITCIYLIWKFASSPKSWTYQENILSINNEENQSLNIELL